MRIRTHVEELALRHTFTISRSSEDVTRVVIAELEHDGVTGLGEASPSSFYDENIDSVRASLEQLGEWLEGRDPLHYRDLLEEASTRLGSNRAALSALDLAVFDWVTRKFGLPLHRLLGLDARRAPLSSFTIGIDSIEKMVAKIREAAGYPIYKIKLGTPDDIGIVRALRKETTAAFRIDANCGWSVSETIDKSKELAELGVEFIEQPLPPEELDAMGDVFEKSAIPVIADESSITPEDVPELRGRFHGINIKLVKCGGILPALRMVHLARAFDMKVMFGCMIESSVAITAAAQLGAMADYLDLDGNILITNDPYSGVRNDGGRLVLPDGWVERC